MQQEIAVLLIGWLAVAALMTGIWFVQRRMGDAGVVDVAWSPGIALLVIFYALVLPGYVAREVLVSVLVSLWGFRLAYYVLRDRILKGIEDGRYQKIREDLGPRFQPWIFGFYQLQAFSQVLFSIPMLIVILHPARSLTTWDIVGAVILLVAVVGESIADRQLGRFRADPANRGQVCQGGLWRYSRHPNYFFEWLHWWAYVVMAIGAPYGWITFFAPILMLFFLFRVTGIPATEARALVTRGDAYRRYQTTTSPFVPWPPRSIDS